MSRFTSPLRIEDTGVERDGRAIWLVLDSFEYEIGAEGSGYFIRVPSGFETDFASIPRGLSFVKLVFYLLGVAAITGVILIALKLFSIMPPTWLFSILWVLLGALVLIGVLLNILNLLPPWGEYRKPAVLHDFLYRKASGFSKVVGDAIFYEAMEISGVKFWKRYFIYLAVSYFGLSAYRWEQTAPKHTEVKMIEPGTGEVKEAFKEDPPKP